MNLNEISLIEHPLRKTLADRHIPLWKLRMALGGQPSENKLNRVLRGIDRMPFDLEQRIEKILAESDPQEDWQ